MKVLHRAAALVGVLCIAAVSCSGDDDQGKQADGSPQAEQASTAERAPAGLVQVLMPEDVEVTLDPLSSSVGTETMRLDLRGTGDVEEIGRGDAIRQPAEGERFVVVEVERQGVDVSKLAPYEQAGVIQRGQAKVSVQQGAAPPVEVNLDTPSYTPLPIDLDSPPQVPPPPADPLAPLRRLIVVSVPEDADAVDLVLGSTALEQRLSLLTGAPGPGNVAVLARQNGVMHVMPPAQEVSATIDEFGLSGSVTQAISVADARLRWSSGIDPDRRTAAPGRAILKVALDTSGLNLALACELRLPDGTVLLPMPPESEILADIDPQVSFDVPADFTMGTLVLGKDYSSEVPTGGTISARFANVVEYPIDIPLMPPAATAPPA